MTINNNISIIRIIARRVRLVEHVASMIFMGDDNKELVQKYMGRPSHTWKDHIKVDLKEIMSEGLHWA